MRRRKLRPPLRFDLYQSRSGHVRWHGLPVSVPGAIGELAQVRVG